MTQTAELTASNGTANDYFRGSVAISGNTVVVGAVQATVGGNADEGAAYVFTEPASGWANMTQTAELTAADGAAGDLFAGSVSISGNTVVVGAQSIQSILPNPGPGAAYVFSEPGSGWVNMTQTAKLTASDGLPGDNFGDSVSISGNTVVVGSTGISTYDGKTSPAAAYVFSEPGSGWADMTQTAELTASGGGYSCFGSSVSISGDTVVVGAIRHDRRQLRARRGLRVYGARLRLGEYDPDRRAHGIGWHGERQFRLVGCNQRQHGAGRSVA